MKFFLRKFDLWSYLMSESSEKTNKSIVQRSFFTLSTLSEDNISLDALCRNIFLFPTRYHVYQFLTPIVFLFGHHMMGF